MPNCQRMTDFRRRQTLAIYELQNPSFPTGWDSLSAFRKLHISQSPCTLVRARHQAFGLRREHAPRTVGLAEEKNSNRACRPQHLNTYIASLIRARATELGYPNRHRRSWRKPFFDQQTQGPFSNIHPLLLQSCSRYLTPALLNSTLRSLGHNESGFFARDGGNPATRP